MIIRVSNKEDLSIYLAPFNPYYFVHLRIFDRFSLELFFTCVFNFECLEILPAYFRPYKNYLIYNLPLRWYQFIVEKLLKVIRKISYKKL